MKNWLRAEEGARPFGGGEDGVRAGTRETRGSAGSSQGSLPPAASGDVNSCFPSSPGSD